MYCACGERDSAHGMVGMMRLRQALLTHVLTLLVALRSALGCAQPIGDLVEDAGVIQVNDKQLRAPLRIRLKYADAMQP